MGGGHELVSPDPQAWPPADFPADYATYSDPAAGDQRLTEALGLFADAVWYLEGAATPEEIQVNVCTVLSYAHALLGGEYHEPLGTECQAWEHVDPATVGLDAFALARDQVVRDAWQLDGLVRSWLADREEQTWHAAYACLDGLRRGATDARLTLG
jgi:hypothetical protein